MLQPLAPTQAAKNPLDALQGFDRTSKTAVKEAAKQFEAVFINNMLQTMFSGVESGGTWGKGTGSDAWQGFLIDEYARSIAESGGIGLAANVERELLAMQEGAQ